MRATVLTAVVIGACVPAYAQEQATFDADAALRFADLALACVDREYPNKIAHVLNSDQDARPPRELTPAFFGCFDWHSAVHGHWLLVRLCRAYPEAPFAGRVRAALGKSFTTERIAAEVAYLRGDVRAPLRPRLTAPALGRVAPMGRPTGECVGDRHRAVGAAGSRTLQGLATQTVASHQNRRTQPDGLRHGAGLRLGPLAE